MLTALPPSACATIIVATIAMFHHTVELYLINLVSLPADLLFTLLEVEIAIEAADRTEDVDESDAYSSRTANRLCSMDAFGTNRSSSRIRVTSATIALGSVSDLFGLRTRR
jgi:hypothetical protein